MVVAMGLEVAFVWCLWLPNVLATSIEVLEKWLKFLPLVVRVGPRHHGWGHDMCKHERTTLRGRVF